MRESLPVSLPDIELAQRHIKGQVLRTPMVNSARLSEMLGVPVWIKWESHQITGSFKVRGATNALARLSADDLRRGVVAASTGNHGRALAYAARKCGAKAVICMSNLVPENKVAEIRRLGGEIHIVGVSQDEAQREVDNLVARDGFHAVPPFDDRMIIAGQGTLGLEIVEDLPETGTVLVPLSGGGLAAGVAAAVKGRNPNARIIGVTMERGAAMKASLLAGQPVEVEEQPSLADSLGGGIGLHNKYTFPMVRALLDDVVLLDEPEIAAGISHAYFQEREILEGAGAVGIAAILAGKISSAGPLVIVASGRNIDMNAHHRIVGDATHNNPTGET